jgi:predicted TIM-barrel fold metal-dependent hydrolase
MAIVLLAFSWLSSAILAQPFPGEKSGPGTAGQSGDPQQRMGMMLDNARQAPSQMWPRQKPMMIDRVVSRMQAQNPGDTAAITAAKAAIGEILERARALSSADFTAQKSQLIAQLMQAMGRGTGNSPPGTASATPGAKPVVNTDHLYAGSMIDAHFHFILPRELPPDQTVSYLRAAGISGAIFFAPSEVSLTNLISRLQRQNADFLFPTVMLPHDAERQILFNDEGLAFMEQLLNGGGMRGVGEIPLRHPVIKRQRGSDFPADGPIALTLFAMAANHKVPINVHVEHESRDELDRAVGQNPNAIVIWAHCGDGPSAEVRDLLSRHPNLNADISCRNPFFHRQHSIEYQSLTAADGTLKEDWKALFEAMPDRFLFGSDVGGASDSLSSNSADPPRHQILKEVVQYYRSVLGQLSPATAEKIAHLNAKRLYGIN